MHQIQSTVKTDGGQPKFAENQAAELAVLRLLAYRNRLAFRPANMKTWNVEYVDVIGGDVNTAGNDAYTRHNEVDAAAYTIKNRYVGVINGMRGHIKKLTSNFSNIVCVVAYVFRSRGHHYLPDFGTIYTSLWEKCRCDLVDFKCDWAAISTIGLHCIMPMILDFYWRHCAVKAKVAPALVLRVDVPAAGTAAVYSILAGWRDIRATYGRAYSFVDQAADELNNIYGDLQKKRWDHSINAVLYGADTTRLDLGRFHQLASVVFGTYKTLEEAGTLVGSKSLGREAANAPLMLDISMTAARQLRKRIAAELTQHDDA